MCKVYNTVGCLTTVKSHLQRHNINEFKSINEVIAFQKGYAAARQDIISKSELAIENEKNNIISENLQLSISIESTKEETAKELLEQIEDLQSQLQMFSSSHPRNAWRRVTNYFRIFFLKRRLRNNKLALPSKVMQSVSQPFGTYQSNENRYNYITSRFQDAVIENCSAELKTLEWKKSVIDEINNSIYGAIGEQKVVKELENLPDEYVLINDFCLTFNPPIYNRNENDHIKSIQADHLLIGPSGVFVIETKNWSEQSLNSLSLRSPVSQIKRSSFALFTILNSESNRLDLNHHQWGRKKIAIKNIVVLINKKPAEEFQYVKVLTLNQLLNYIKYFPPIFTRRETDEIANELISLSGK